MFCEDKCCSSAVKKGEKHFPSVLHAFQMWKHKQADRCVSICVPFDGLELYSVCRFCGLIPLTPPHLNAARRSFMHANMRQHSHMQRSGQQADMHSKVDLFIADLMPERKVRKARDTLWKCVYTHVLLLLCCKRSGSESVFGSE